MAVVWPQLSGQIIAVRLRFKFVSLYTLKKGQRPTSGWPASLKKALIKLEICVTNRQRSRFKNRPREEKTWKRKKTRFCSTIERGSKADESFLTLWTRSLNEIREMSRNLNTPPSYEINPWQSPQPDFGHRLETRGVARLIGLVKYWIPVGSTWRQNGLPWP